jgi:hypothetical protein
MNSSTIGGAMAQIATTSADNSGTEDDPRTHPRAVRKAGSVD